MPHDFETKRELARAWEQRMGEWARRRGWYVLPTYDYSGRDDDKAPKLLAPPGRESLVLPDLQCVRPGETRWLEIKWKASCTRYVKGGYRTTGISLRLWEHYSQVELLTGGGVWVVFLHQEEQEIRGDSLADLHRKVSHQYDGRKMGRGGMIFFRYDKLTRWGSLSMLAQEAA